MSHLHLLAFCLYLVVAVLAFAAGLTYLLRTRFMSFHEAAVGQRWESIPANIQALVLTLMRAAGAAYVAVALCFFAVLAVPFRAGAAWANICLLVVGLALCLGSLSAMALLSRRTNTSQPIAAPLFAAALCTAAFCIAYFSARPSAP